MYVFLLECVCTSTDKKNKNMIITWMLLIRDGLCSVTEVSVAVNIKQSSSDRHKSKKISLTCPNEDC